MDADKVTSRELGIEILRWYKDAGVDLAIDEMPHDRFEEGRVAARAKSVHGAGDAARNAEVAVTDDRAPVMPLHFPAGMATGPARETGSGAHTVTIEEAIALSNRLAREAGTLQELRSAMETFDGCALKATASRLVFGDGDEHARLMIVGEAPGREEDQQGVPFVGRAGQLLNRMLASIGLKRTDVYIANVIPWRPPGNRTPTAMETSICKPFIERQIALVAPEILLCLGNPASQTLLKQKAGILSIRGRWFDYAAGTGGIKAMPSLHPAYLLRQPSQKKLAWMDLIAIRKQLGTQDFGNG